MQCRQYTHNNNITTAQRSSEIRNINASYQKNTIAISVSAGYLQHITMSQQSTPRINIQSEKYNYNSIYISH